MKSLWIWLGVTLIIVVVIVGTWRWQLGLENAPPQKTMPSSTIEDVALQATTTEYIDPYYKYALTLPSGWFAESQYDAGVDIPGDINVFAGDRQHGILSIDAESIYPDQTAEANIQRIWIQNRESAREEKQTSDLIASTTRHLKIFQFSTTESFLSPHGAFVVSSVPQLFTLVPLKKDILIIQCYTTEQVCTNLLQTLRVAQ